METAMQIKLERTIAAPIWAVWRALTHPDAMNRWSTAKIRLIRNGDAARPDTVGAQRIVLVPTPRGTQRLNEVIEISEAPVRLVYRVIDSPPIESHRGEIHIAKHGDGVRLTWTVDATFMVPGLDLLAKPLLQKELERSLNRLPGTLAAITTDPLPENPAPNDDKELDALFAAAEQTLAEQREHAQELTARNDPKRWFPIVYQYVTEEQIRRCREGVVQMPAWTLRLIPVFHRYYYDENYLPWIEGREMETGRHWVRAFELMENDRIDPARALFGGLQRAIIAHIQEDLPRALAEVWWRWYRGRCDYARYRADYLLMGDVFSRSAQRAIDHIPTQLIPAWARLLQRITPPAIQDQLQNERFYNIPKQRVRTFERGQRLVETMETIAAAQAG
ncbi:MAG: SRPBCC family protein [Candidatus Dadabacteria bacterium]|nr:MAG: SRPBCC family protein [Candidatus Dadabacteria bacterium]